MTNASTMAFETTAVSNKPSRSGILGLYVSLATNPLHDAVFIGRLLAAELVLGVFIIRFVTYTEIDWEAYMQEVEIWWLEGEYDYRNIYGGTGPLVYPAGFLYLFVLLRQLTANGKSVLTAQYIFLAFYLAIQAVVLLLVQEIVRHIRRVAASTTATAANSATSASTTTSTTTSNDNDNLRLAHSVWSWRIAMASLCLSKRIHSIFMLRLFNDGPTMLLLYVSMLLFTRNKWNWGCFVFSLAVSIKMNVLLFAPGLLLLLLQVGPDFKTVFYRLALCCALPQLVLGAPFLLTFPVSYLRKAFELDRVFFYKWTVNFKVRRVASI
jgi:alpha-1,3-mannosyltransferase